MTLTRGSRGNTTVPSGIALNIAGKMEIFQIFQKILFKQSCAAKVVDIILFKMQIFNIFDDLLQTGTDRVAAPYRLLR